MEATCARALELGLPAIAFTEHADFTAWTSRHGVENAHWATRHIEDHTERGDLDIAAYWECLDRCRARFPELRIESGVELGEPHLFPEESARLLGHRPLDRVLGSLHCIELDGVLADMSIRGVLSAEHATERTRAYLRATLDLVESDAPFAILTHMDYPKRFWPHAELRFDEHVFEDEYRDVLRALARSGRALEINTSRAIPAPRAPCPGPVVLRWWHEAGGVAVSFGSDTHSPDHLAAGFAEAAAMAEAAGFRPNDDPAGLWLR